MLGGTAEESVFLRDFSLGVRPPRDLGTDERSPMVSGSSMDVVVPCDGPVASAISTVRFRLPVAGPRLRSSKGGPDVEDMVATFHTEVGDRAWGKCLGVMYVLVYKVERSYCVHEERCDILAKVWQL